MATRRCRRCNGPLPRRKAEAAWYAMCPNCIRTSGSEAPEIEKIDVEPSEIRIVGEESPSPSPNTSPPSKNPAPARARRPSAPRPVRKRRLSGTLLAGWIGAAVILTLAGWLLFGSSKTAPSSPSRYPLSPKPQAKTPLPLKESVSYPRPLTPKPVVEKSALLYRTKPGDGAALYRALFAKKPFSELTEELIHYLDTGEGDPTTASLHIDRLADPLRKLEEAALARTCTWTYESLHIDIDAPHILPGIHAARLLVERGRSRIDNGLRKEGLRDLLVILKMGSDYLKDRILLGNVTGLYQTQRATWALRDHIASGDLGREHVSSLKAHLADLLASYPSTAQALTRERESLLGTADLLVMRGVKALGELVEAGSGQPNLLNAGVLPMADLERLVAADPKKSREIITGRWTRGYDLLIKQATVPPYEKRVVFDRNAFAADSNKAFQDLLASGRLLDPGNRDRSLKIFADFMLPLFLPNLQDLRDVFLRTRMSLDVLHTTCLLEVHHAREGNYPDTLAHLGSPVPTDVYDGKELKYKRLVEKGYEAFVLTSAGPLDDAPQRIAHFAIDCSYDRDKFAAMWPHYPEALEYMAWGFKE